MKKSLFLISIVIAFSQTLQTHAQGFISQNEAEEQRNPWIRTGGPFGGQGYDIKIDPTNSNNIYVTELSTGIYKSVDGGNSWSPSNRGIDLVSGEIGEVVPIFTVGVSPSAPNVVWTGTINSNQGNMGGAFKSVDGGLSWERRVNGMPLDTEELTFRSFSVHPENPDIVYCGVGVVTDEQDTLTPWTIESGKIFKSVDGGDNWAEILNTDALVRYILIDYTNPDILYATTGLFDRAPAVPNGVGILKSTDAGETWFPINNGLSALTVPSLDMHPTNPSILLAGTGLGGGNFPGNIDGGVYMTTDGGQNWTMILKDAIAEFSFFSAVGFSPSNPDIIYAAIIWGFFRSDDGGKTWQRFETPTEIPHLGFGPLGFHNGVPIDLEIDPKNPFKVYVDSYEGGALVTHDGGETFEIAGKGITGAPIFDVAVSQSDPSLVYAVNGRDPHKSEDGGLNWEGIAFGRLRHQSIIALSLNKDDHADLLVSNWLHPIIGKSVDGGRTWRLVYESIIEDLDVSFKAVVRAPSNQRIIYAGTRIGNQGVINEYDSSNPPPKALGIFKSEDDGESWREINSGLENTLMNINDIAVDPNDPDVVYAGLTVGGIYKSTDGGQSWIGVNDGLPSMDVLSLATDQHTSEIIYAGMRNASVYKSVDGGVSWGFKGIGLEPEVSVRDIVIDPTDSNTMYVAANGVFRSSDAGETWISYNDGLVNREVEKLAISADGKVLYAGVDGGGVWKLTIGNNPSVDSQRLTGQIPEGTPLIIQARISDGDSIALVEIVYSTNEGEFENTEPMALVSDGLDENLYSGELPQQTAGTIIKYFVRAVDTKGNEATDPPNAPETNYEFQISFPTGVEQIENNITPKEFSLSQNYPNPFNPNTTIQFNVKETTHVTLNIYNLIGQKVKTLANRRLQSGIYKVNFDASHLASGVYLYLIEMADFKKTRKMLFLK